jgi:L-serine deaminase
VIETMRYSGVDMQPEYKETSRGELSDNVPEC